MTTVLGPGAVLLPGAVLGLVAGVGLWLIVLGLPAGRGPSLDDRLAPYLGTHLPSQRRAGGALAVVTAVLEPVARRAEGWISRMGSDPVSVRRRLGAAGSPLQIEQFRAQQVLCAIAGTAAGSVVVGLAAAAGHGVDSIRAAALVAASGLAGALGRDQALSWRVRRREDRILAQFPAVAELLALSVAAGEGALGALDRVARTCSGDLADELRLALADTRTGLPLTDALQRMAGRAGVPGLSGFVDGLVVALERGTPLADVLRAQAQDVRVLSRRRLMESGGRKEILMMIPVVFLILPITVLFAVYPGMAVLDLNL